jgi:hypothetical protein
MAFNQRPETDFNARYVSNPLQFTNAELFDWQDFMNGKTIRQSWIRTGKEITQSVHSH